MSRQLALIVALLVVPVVPGAAAELPAVPSCPAADPALPGSPELPPAGQMPSIAPGGSLDLLIDDAFPLTEGAFLHDGGTGYAHFWPVDGLMVVYGRRAPDGTALPEALVELHDDSRAVGFVQGLPESGAAIGVLAGGEPVAERALSIAVYLAVMSVGVAGGDEGASPDNALLPAEDEILTALIWHTLHDASGTRIWTGYAVTSRANVVGTFQSTEAASCVRTQIDPVIRVGEAPAQRAGAGLYIIDRYHGARDQASQTREEHANVEVGLRVAGVDVPTAFLDFHDASSAQGGEVASQEATLTAGATNSIPLLTYDTRTTFGVAPDAFRQEVRVGVHDTNGDFVPLLGSRLWFERQTPIGWEAALVGGCSPDGLTLNEGGLGSSCMGDWTIDTGAYVPGGAFQPLLGLSYDDRLAHVRGVPTGVDARYWHEGFLTAGTFVSERYAPLVGLTYDGERSHSGAMNASAGDVEERRSYLLSTGTFLPDGRYVPAAGADSVGVEEAGVYHEHLRPGVFAGSYDLFVPLAEVRMTSESGYPVPLDTNGGARTLDVGVDPAGTGFVPLVGVHSDGMHQGESGFHGDNDDHTVGAWVDGEFVPLAHVCFGHDNSLALGGQEFRLGVGTGDGTWLASGGVDQHNTFTGELPTLYTAPQGGCPAINIYD